MKLPAKDRELYSFLMHKEAIVALKDKKIDCISTRKPGSLVIVIFMCVQPCTPPIKGIQPNGFASEPYSVAHFASSAFLNIGRPDVPENLAKQLTGMPLRLYTFDRGCTCYTLTLYCMNRYKHIHVKQLFYEPDYCTVVFYRCYNQGIVLIKYLKFNVPFNCLSSAFSSCTALLCEHTNCDMAQ